jgi:hypothetical protein
MPGPLYRLLYCSRNMIGANAASGQAVDVEAELRAILATARRRNKEDNITGALLFTASGFAQALEGYREAVERTFERIGSDPRHTDVTVLTFAPTERRSFPDWPMGFSGQTKEGLADPLARLLTDAAIDERATTGGDLLRMLEKLVQHEDEWIVA